MQVLEGRELGGCRLLRKIGAGGMGEVYLGEQLRMGNRLVAIKIVNPDDHTFSQEVADDLKRRFEREAALLGRLSHPNILPVHDSGVQDGLLFMVMEYVPDGSLADAIRGTSKHPLRLPVSLPFALDLLGQLGDALQYTHDNGVVHRDVKPGNVLVRVRPDGHWNVLLADFGVARGLDTSSQRTQVTGTFAFMAPEQFSGKFSPASDQYALGVLAFLLLGGRTPFDGDLAALTRAHMFDPPPSLCALNRTVPVELESVIYRALAKDPAERWPSVAAFTQALKAAATGEAQATRPVAEGGGAADRSTAALNPAARRAASATTNRATADRGPWRILVTAFAALLLLASVVGAVAFVQHQQEGTGAEATPTPRATVGPPVTVVPGGLSVCAAALQVSDNASCIPSPPVSHGESILNSPAPLCDTSGTNWAENTNTAHTCNGATSVTVKDTSPATQHTLACEVAVSVASADGYASVYVTKGDGDPVLGIRQGQASASGSQVNITGYYFRILPATNQYLFYKVGTNGAPGSVIPKSLPGTLAANFVMGVLYKGSSFTLYINGQPVGTETDATLTTGGFGVCVDHGSATFRYAQVFPLAG